jgi:hypothetical protein
VPLLVYCNVPIHQAVGTSAACGLPIAVAGAIGFVYPRPWWPGAPSAPLGARLAPALPVATGVRGGGRAHRPQDGGLAGSIQALGRGRAYRTRPQARKREAGGDYGSAGLALSAAPVTSRASTGSKNRRGGDDAEIHDQAEVL